MRRFIMILGIFALLLISSSRAQQRWTRTYGGWNMDEGWSVQQTLDGGYIVAGWTATFGAGGADVYLVKTDASGNALWTKTYGGTGDEFGYSVQQTSDGGYIIAGRTNSFGAGGRDVYVVKTNSSGDTLWTKTYGGTSDDWGQSVQQTSDGGYIIAGTTSSYGVGYMNVYIIKTDSSGDTLWTRTYGGANGNSGSSVQQTSDGGYIIAGTTSSFGAGSADFWLIKTNASGDTLWTRTYGGTGDDEGYSVQQTSDGGYIITGYTASFGAGSNDVYLIKTNASGDTLWTRTYGGTNWDEGRSVRQTSDGGYIIAGMTSSFGAGNYDIWVIKTNASGDTLWTKTFGGANYEWGYSVQQTSDRGYIIAGYTDSYGAGNHDVYLIKTDANGNVGVEDPGGSKQKAVVRLAVQPNPFMSFTRVPGHEVERFKLYDVSGRLVGTYKGDRIGEGLAAGVYFLRSSDNKDEPLRIVKVR